MQLKAIINGRVVTIGTMIKLDSWAIRFFMERYERAWLVY